MTQTMDEIVHSDVWDSREAIERIEELESLNDGAEDNLDGHMDPEDYSELLAWREFLDCDYLPTDWQYGEGFIADHYFKSYAQEFAEDIGAISSSSDYQWPQSHIDWDDAADALREDYTSYELAGHTFWARS